MSQSLISPGQSGIPVQKDGPGPDQWGSWFDNKYYTLRVVQHPMRARMCGFGDKDRRPLAPAAIAKLILTSKDGSEVDVDDIAYDFLVVTADLWSEDGRSENNLVIHQAYLESRANRASSSNVQQPPNPSGISPGVPGEGPPESQSTFPWPNVNPGPFPMQQAHPSSSSLPSTYPSTWANPQSQSRAIPFNAPTATADRHRTSNGGYTTPSSIHNPSNIDMAQDPAPDFSSNAAAAERTAGMSSSSSNSNGRQGSGIPMLPGIRETFFLQSTPGYQAQRSNTTTTPMPIPWNPIGMANSAAPIPGSSSMTTTATSPTAATHPSSWPSTTAYTSHAAGASGAFTSHSGIPGSGSGSGPSVLPSSSPPSGVGSGTSHHTPHRAVHAHNIGSNTLSTGSGYGSGPPGVAHHVSQESTSSSTSSSSIGGASRPTAPPPPMRSSSMQSMTTTTPPGGGETPSSANAIGSVPAGVSGSGNTRLPKYTRMLIGPVAAGAALLRDENDHRGIFFIFQDLSVRTEGKFRLRLRLLNVGAPESPQVNQDVSPVLAQAYTEAFEVFTAKRFPGVPPITSLSAALGRQGQKLPLRTRSDAHTGTGPPSRSRRRGHRVGRGSGDDYSGEDNDNDHDGGGRSDGDD